MKVTKKTKWGLPAFALVFVLILAAGLVVAGCLDSIDDGTGNGGNPFIGTWTGYHPDYGEIKLIVDSSTWTATYETSSDTVTIGIALTMTNAIKLEQEVVTGTYTYSGNTATFFQNGVATGTATVSGNTMTAIMAGFGTFILTK